MAGRPIWYELMTPEPATVAPFYKALLGWELQGMGTETPTGHPYWMIGRPDGGFAGGVLLLTPEMTVGGARPGWLPYFHVEDVRAATVTAEGLGAKVWLAPMDTPFGTMAMLGDPFGAAFYLMTPTPPPDQPDAVSDVFKADGVGHCQWNELQTPDEAASTAFYKALLGWTAENSMPMGDKGEYRFVEAEGEAIGAINPWGPEWMPTGWLPYFGVADIDAARAAAEREGAAIHSETHEVPGGSFIFTATDPAGAPVGFVGPKKEA